MCTKLYNQLPEEIKAEENTGIFINKLDDFLQKKSYVMLTTFLIKNGIICKIIRHNKSACLVIAPLQGSIALQIIFTSCLWRIMLIANNGYVNKRMNNKLHLFQIKFKQEL